MIQKETITDSLRGVELPQAFSSRKGAGETICGVYSEKIIVQELEREKLERVYELLTHPSLQKLIDAGQITFGIIKPQANEGQDLPEDDDEAAQVILDEIGEKNYVFAMPFRFTRDQADQFYSHLGNKLDKEIYNEIIDFTVSGGLTVMLIRREEGDAISWWRDKMGDTWPADAKLNSPNSIRARYSRSLPNNIVHGSDSIDSVKIELGIFSDGIKRLVDVTSSVSEN